MSLAFSASVIDRQRRKQSSHARLVPPAALRAGLAECGRPWASESWSGINLRRLGGVGRFDEAAAVECDQ